MRVSAIVVLVVALGSGGCQQGERPVPGADTPESSNASGTTAAVAAPRAAADAPVVAAAPPPPVTPAFREVTIPAGTTLSLVLDTPVASDTSQVEAAVRAHLARPVLVDGVAALPGGSAVLGVVDTAERAGKVKGLAKLAVRFTGVTREGETERYRIETSDVARTAQSTRSKDVAKIGVPAAGGAIVGGIIGGGKGAAIGSAVGGGAGTAVVLSTRGEEVRLAKGVALKVQLTEALTVRVPQG
jgi:hypothetical protein